MFISAKKLTIFIFAMATAILFFQNCAKPYMASNFESESPAVNYSVDADIGWSTKMLPPDMNQLEKVEKWKDFFGRSVLLFPPFRNNTTTVDMEKSPRLLGGPRSYVRFGEYAYLSPASSDFSELIGDEFTILLVVKDVKLPTVDPKLIRLFELYPVDGSETGHMGIDVSPDDDGFLMVAYSWFNPQTVVSQKFHLSAEDLEKPMVLAMSFPKMAETMKFYLNGTESPNPVEIIGTPPFQGSVGRQLAIHGVNYGQLGELSFGEIVFWKRILTPEQIVQKSNLAYSFWSVTEPLPIPEPTPAPTPNPNPTEIQFATMIASLSSCVGCHSTKLSSRTALNDNTISDATSGKSAWVVPGDPDSSLLLKVLRHEAGVSAMPKGGTKLGDDKIEIVRQWIEQGAL